MTALMTAVVAGFRSTRDTHTSLDQSNAEQIITTYVTKDIQAADSVVVAPVMGTCRAGESKAKLELTMRSGALVTSPVVNVRYVLRTNGELPRVKMRLFLQPSPVTSRTSLRAALTPS